MHHCNNYDHSMLTALLVAMDILGKDHGIWNVNVEPLSEENFTDKEWIRRQRLQSSAAISGIEFLVNLSTSL